MSGPRKSIVITGAASGIGRATATHFIEKGWFVGAFDIDEPGLQAIADSVGSADCMTHVLNVKDLESWEQAVDAFLRQTGGHLNVLFNNAGVGAAGWFEDIPPEVAGQIVDVNLLGAINGVYACREALKNTPEAHVVNNGSVLALQGPPFGAVYGATKAGLKSLTESLELELARDGIAVSLLLPSEIDTPLTEGRAFTDLKRTDANRRRTSPGVVAQAVWRTVHTPKLYVPVGEGAGFVFWMARWMPRVLRWLTRRWLKGVSDS